MHLSARTYWRGDSNNHTNRGAFITLVTGLVWALLRSSFLLLFPLLTECNSFRGTIALGTSWLGILENSFNNYLNAFTDQVPTPCSRTTSVNKRDKTWVLLTWCNWGVWRMEGGEEGSSRQSNCKVGRGPGCYTLRKNKRGSSQVQLQSPKGERKNPPNWVTQEAIKCGFCEPFQ